jgi:hypothetical protein
LGCSGRTLQAARLSMRNLCLAGHLAHGDGKRQRH